MQNPPTWVQERMLLQQQYHEYLMGELEYQCRQAGIGPPIHLLSTTGDGANVTFQVGNDPPGPSILVTYRKDDLLPPPPSIF